MYTFAIYVWIKISKLLHFPCYRLTFLKKCEIKEYWRGKLTSCLTGLESAVWQLYETVVHPPVALQAIIITPAERVQSDLTRYFLGLCRTRLNKQKQNKNKVCLKL